MNLLTLSPSTKNLAPIDLGWSKLTTYLDFISMTTEPSMSFLLVTTLSGASNRLLSTLLPA